MTAANCASTWASTRSVFAEVAHRLGKVARLARIHDDHGEASGLQGAGERVLVATAGLHQHDIDGVGFELRRQGVPSLGVIGHALDSIGPCRIQMRLGHIDSSARPRRRYRFPALRIHVHTLTTVRATRLRDKTPLRVDLRLPYELMAQRKDRFGAQAAKKKPQRCGFVDDAA